METHDIEIGNDFSPASDDKKRWNKPELLIIKLSVTNFTGSAGDDGGGYGSNAS